MSDPTVDVNTTQLVLYQNEEIREAIRNDDDGKAIALRKPGGYRAGHWEWVGHCQVIA